MKVLRKIIEIDEELCDGCGECVPSCAEGALQIVDGKARVISDNLCDGLGACLGECPNDALRVIEREAEDFDESAVEAHLEEAANKAENRDVIFSGGCPSAAVHTFVPAEKQVRANTPAAGNAPGELTHWPVQIMLIPPTAPFLKGADLLVVADCAPIAYPTFHSDFLRDKVVMMGCPKFDDADAYVEKFTDIFSSAGVSSVTSLYMEVPCCSGLPMIVRKAMAAAGTDVPYEEVVLSRRGEILAPADAS
ncbi:Ferredoxin 3 fused to uncharacterized domain [Olavius algarvensis associated proteobacterium Delta 3]|nr:Ferredoxin 3 fused to uncharacterized domain [Olavius algarvensis associated proteobacterium Delta 3]